MSKRKILTCCIFIIAGLMVGAVVVTATSYIQLAVAIFLYTLFSFFVFKAFPRKTLRYLSKKPVIAVQTPVMADAGRQAETARRENVGISDIEKREFLKLIGGAGITLFLFSIFNKRAEGLLPGIAPGPGLTLLKDTAGNKIDPAQS